MKNKKADVTITTVILVIAGIAVLAMLIFWLVSGGGQFGGWIGNLFGKQNVGTLQGACQVPVVCESNYDYCVYKRDLYFQNPDPNIDKLVTTKVTCGELKKGDPVKIDGKTIALPKVDIICDMNCEDSSADKVVTDLETCSQLGGTGGSNYRKWTSVYKTTVADKDCTQKPCLTECLDTQDDKTAEVTNVEDKAYGEEGPINSQMKFICCVPKPAETPATG